MIIESSLREMMMEKVNGKVRKGVLHNVHATTNTLTSPLALDWLKSQRPQLRMYASQKTQSLETPRALGQEKRGQGSSPKLLVNQSKNRNLRGPITTKTLGLAPESQPTSPFTRHYLHSFFFFPENIYSVAAGCVPGTELDPGRDRLSYEIQGRAQSCAYLEFIIGRPLALGHKEQVNKRN